MGLVEDSGLLSDQQHGLSHQAVALSRDAMFYRVVALKFYRDAEADILDSLRSHEKTITLVTKRNVAQR